MTAVLPIRLFAEAEGFSSRVRRQRRDDAGVEGGASDPSKSSTLSRQGKVDAASYLDHRRRPGSRQVDTERDTEHVMNSECSLPSAAARVSYPHT